MDLASRFEYATDADPSLSYCLWPYPAPCPAADKFRSINLLHQSLALAGIDERAFALIEAVRDAVGPFRTVFGVKWVDGRLGWELYFYDYRRLGRALGVGRVLGAIKPWAASAVSVADTLPYFMFSIDLDDALVRGERALDLVHVYVGNPGSAVSSGIAYGVRADSTTLENFYFFFDAATEMAQVVDKLQCSALVDFSRVHLDEVLLPSLRDCRTICVANKRGHDCIYFSGVTVRQLLGFLRRLNYPPPTIDFVTTHDQRLDHLLFDVGIDYTMRDGRLQVLKSGYYGVF